MKNRKKYFLLLIIGIIAFSIIYILIFDKRIDITIPKIPKKALKNPLLSKKIREIQNEILNEKMYEKTGQLGMIYHANLFFDEAVECYIQAEKIEEDNHKWSYLHAFINQKMGKTDLETISLLKKSTDRGTIYNPAILNLGDIYFKLSRFDEAKRYYKRLLEDNELSKYALLGMGRIEMRNNNMEKAGENFKKAYKTDPKFGVAYRMMAEIFKKQNRPEMVKSFRARARSFRFAEAPNPWVDELVEYCFDPDELIRIADSMLKMKKIEQGLAATDRAISLYPDNMKICRIIGNDLLSLGYFKRSIAFFDKILNKDNNDIEAITNKGAALLSLSKREEAEKYILYALEKDPDSHLANYNAGFLFYRKGDMKTAKKHFKKTIKLNPEFARAYYNLGIILKNEKKLSESKRNFEKSLELKSTMKGPNLHIGLINLIKGNKEEGISFLKKEIENEPESFRAYYFLANENFLKKNFSDSEKYYKKALEIYPEFREARSNLANLYENRGWFEKAAEQYRILSLTYPDELRWQILLGKNLLNSGEKPEGKKILTDVLQRVKSSGNSQLVKFIENLLKNI